jgi:hypothetical protein
MQKEIIPNEISLQQALGLTFPYWKRIQTAAQDLGKVEKEGWHYSGEKHGWSYRMSDKKRVLVYLLPRDGYFKVAFVFGDKAIEVIQKSAIDPKIVEELLAAKKYAEGRGIRIDVREDRVVADILRLLEIKNTV